MHNQCKQSKYRLSDHGQIVTMLHQDAQHDRRLEMCGQHMLVNFENSGIKLVAQKVMNDPMEQLRNLGLVNYAKTTVGIYIWMSEQEATIGIKFE
jgi:hypothetical protein